MAGPFVCKREGASQTTRRNPGTMKVWAVLVVCLQVKAVKIYLVGGLHTEDFLLAWDSFVADYGLPMVAHGDRGTNLTSAAKEDGNIADMPSYDWDKIAGQGAVGLHGGGLSGNSIQLGHSLGIGLLTLWSRSLRGP